MLANDPTASSEASQIISWTMAHLPTVGGFWGLPTAVITSQLKPRSIPSIRVSWLVLVHLAGHLLPTCHWHGWWMMMGNLLEASFSAFVWFRWMIDLSHASLLTFAKMDCNQYLYITQGGYQRRYRLCMAQANVWNTWGTRLSCTWCIAFCFLTHILSLSLCLAI